MMRHQIKAYQSDFAAFQNSPTPLFWWGTGLTTLTAALLIGMPFGTFYALCLLPLALHVLLWITNERFLMEEAEVKYWKMYRDLPREYQKKINLSRDYFVSLEPGDEWNVLKDNIEQLHDLYKANTTTKGLPDPVATGFRAAIEIEQEKAQTRAATENEMALRGWSA